MRRAVWGMIAFVAACSPAASLPATPTPSAAPSVIATSTETATARPSAPTAAPAASPDARLYPKVAVSGGVFAVMTTYRLKLATVDEDVVNAARFAVERYVNSIDQYRDGKSPALPISGSFLTAVSAALRDSATPGITRHFELESLTVDHHVQKPWGTHAYVEVTVALADRSVGGVAPDQHEVGRLRLTGDPLLVTDGWDFDHDRWFNGFGPLPLDQVRAGVSQALTGYLAAESWSPNAPSTWSWSVEGSPYQRARATRVLAIDRQQTTTQFFEGVNAAIEQFETIDGIWSGVATVRITGTRVTTSATGQTARAAFDRHVRIFLLGNWSPEVVDEQSSSGDWVSGGDLALAQLDTSRA